MPQYQKTLPAPPAHLSAPALGAVPADGDVAAHSWNASGFGSLGVAPAGERHAADPARHPHFTRRGRNEVAHA